MLVFISMAPARSTLVLLLFIGCSRRPAPDAGSKALDFPLRALLADRSGSYQGRFVKTTGRVVTRGSGGRDRAHLLVLAEPGAHSYGDTPLLDCFLADMMSSSPAWGDEVEVVGIVGGNFRRALDTCSLASNGRP